MHPEEGGGCQTLGLELQCGMCGMAARVLLAPLLGNGKQRGWLPTWRTVPKATCQCALPNTERLQPTRFLQRTAAASQAHPLTDYES